MIRVGNLSRTYESGMLKVKALIGLNLEVPRGEFLAVMGPSGSGKSTLMNILGCLDRNTSGFYFLDGVSVSELNETDLAAIRNQKIGFIFQTFNLLPRIDALRNVELPLLYSGVSTSERRHRAHTALERVGLASHAHHRPNELSGGQRQKVAIARALVNNPPVLLADEPTGNLDTRSGLEIMNLIQELHQQGSTIVLVTHEHEISRYADRVINFRDGRLVGSEMNPSPLNADEELKRFLMTAEEDL